MHLVTKILIVFAALFAVLLAALAMAFSYNAETLRDSINAERAQNAAYVVSLNASQTTWQTDLANAKTKLEQAAKEKSDMEKDLATAQNERAKLMADLRAKELEAASFMNESKGKDTRLATMTQILASLNEENASLRGEHVRLSKEMTETGVRLADLESQNQVANQNVRSLQEQMADMVAAAAKKNTTASTGSFGTEITTGPLITARVSKIAKAPSGDDLAFISAGSQAGIKPGQRLNIVRGNKYVAGLVITNVDVNSAVGRIDTLGTSNTVAAEDTVLSRVN